MMVSTLVTIASRCLSATFNLVRSQENQHHQRQLRLCRCFTTDSLPRGVPGTVVRASTNSGTRRLRKETHDLYWFRPSTWSSNNLTSSFGVSLFALYCFEYRVCVLFLQWVPSPALYSLGAERRCLCPIRIQGQSPKLRFRRLSLYSLS